MIAERERHVQIRKWNERRAALRAAVAWAAVLAVGAAAPIAAAQEDGAGTCVPELRITSVHETNFVRLEWDAVAGAGFYDVHRAVDGSAFAHHATVAAPLTSFEETAPDGVVEYRVAADGHPGEECPTQAVHFGGEPPPPGGVACVVGLLAEPRPDASVLVTWDAWPGAESYHVHLVGDDDGGELAMLPGDTAAFVHEGLDAGTTYVYAVAANGPPPEDCPTAAATAIPVFSGVAAAAAACIGAAAAFAFARRR